MRRWFLLLLLSFPFLAIAEMALPPVPAARISDQTGVFDTQTKRRFARMLAAEYARTQISVYVATVNGVKSSEGDAFATRLLGEWITDDLGLVILYAEDIDKVFVSLTKSAFKKVAAGGRLEELASEIDHLNEKGPEVGLPKVANAILDRMRARPVVATPSSVPEQFEKSVMETSVGLVLLLVCLLLGVLGIIKLIRYARSHNVFTPSYTIKNDAVRPILGSAIGGVNTAEGKF